MPLNDTCNKNNKTILSKLIRMGHFARILDEKNNLSLTNLGVMIVFGKLVFSNDVISPVDIGALIGTLLSYQAKRYTNNKNNNDNV